MNSVDFYTKNLGPIVRITEGIFQDHLDLLKWSPDSESVMDIGVGDGLISSEVIIPHLLTNLKEYIGCDISEEALTAARKRIKIPNSHFIYMDIKSKNLPQEYINRFDHVFCHRCLHNLNNIEDMRQAFRNIYDMLKPGGQFFISTFEESPLDQAYEILDYGKWRKHNHRRAISCFYKHKNALDELTNIIVQEGFLDVFTKVEPDYFIPFGEKSYIEAHICVNPIMPHINEEDKEAYVKDFITSMKNGSLTQTISNGESKNEVNIVTVKLLVAIASKPL